MTLPRRLHISLVFGALLGTATTVLAADARPNILFILTDDQAPSGVGFAGNSQLKTPHMDRIAEEGAVLTNSFVVTPVCSPSRASLATSRYGSELGIIDWINPRTEEEHGLNPNTVTWMELLQDAGYRTGLAGKWHLGTADRYHPTLTGYDFFGGFRSGGTSPKDPVLEIDGHEAKRSGFTADLITDQALRFLDMDDEGPFLLSVHYRAPHSAWLPVREEDWEPYKDLDPQLPEHTHPELDTELVKQRLREYYASIASVDRNIGRLLAWLDENEQSENTLIVFTSDHGYHTGHYGLWFKGNAHWVLNDLPPQVWDHIPPKRRPNMYDQALRVPTALRWPTHIEPGTQISRTVTNLDWYPTLTAAADVEIPDELPIRGRSILPLLTVQSSQWDDAFYAEYSMRHGATVDMRAWRTPDWKLMIDYNHPGRAELYHLATDPNELENLIASEEPEVVAVRSKLEEKIKRQILELRAGGP